MVSVKRMALLGMLVGMVSLPSYARVVTGEQTDTNLHLQYPLVYTDNIEDQDSINKDIAKYVQSAKQAYYNSHIYKVWQNYKVTYEDSQVVSILLTTNYYHAGAAHEHYFTNGLVYNKVTGQRIPLYNYVKIASVEQLAMGLRTNVLSYYTETRKKTYLPQGWHVIHVSDDYCLRGGGIIDLIYQPYQLGPFSYGNTFIEFSPSAIEYFNRMNN